MIRILAFLFLIVSFVGCGDEKEQRKSPRIKNITALEAPAINSRFAFGDTIAFRIALSSDTVSIQNITLLENTDTVFFSKDTSFDIVANKKVGKPDWKLYITLSNGKTESYYPAVNILAPAKPTEYTYRIINTFPHDPDAFTQGLLIHQGQLYESTGQKGSSSLRRVDLSSGRIEEKVIVEDQYHAEGLAVYGGKLYQLTWEANSCFVYNLTTFEKLDTFTYPTEGWGLTTIGDSLAMTDGSANIYYKNPERFTELSKIQAYDDKGPIRKLNELEFINGKIYANIWQTDEIVIIDPKTGIVEGKINLEGIFDSRNYRRRLDVLNGIAYDQDQDKIYVTGKYWPKLFEIELINRSNI